MNNFNTTMAIVSGLNSPAIGRLSRTWASYPPEGLLICCDASKAVALQLLKNPCTLTLAVHFRKL